MFIRFVGGLGLKKLSFYTVSGGTGFKKLRFYKVIDSLGLSFAPWGGGGVSLGLFGSFWLPFWRPWIPSASFWVLFFFALLSKGAPFDLVLLWKTDPQIIN